MVVGREIQDQVPWAVHQGNNKPHQSLTQLERSDTDVEYMETHCALSTTDDFGTVYNYSDTYLEAIYLQLEHVSENYHRLGETTLL